MASGPFLMVSGCYMSGLQERTGSPIVLLGNFLCEIIVSRVFRELSRDPETTPDLIQIDI